METITYKNRKRLNRGRLVSFYDLSDEIQEKFKLIKASIIKSNPNTKCYVMGSYYWGFWDDSSDLDVVVDTQLSDVQKIKDYLPNIKFDILNIKGFRDIEIP